MEQLEPIWATLDERWPPHLRDKLTIALLAGGLALNLAFWLGLALTYRSMPQFVPLHWDALGNPDRIAPRGDIFSLAIIGSLVYLVDGVLGIALSRRIPFAGYLLWGGAALVQILLIVAAFQIIT